MYKFLALASLLSFSVFAQDEIGFSKGNTFTNHEVRGSFTLQCPTRSAYATCAGNYLSPVEADYFVHPDAIVADKIELSNVNGRGRTVKKDANFDSDKLRSTKRFNLWIATLTQRPLLKMGANNISYKLSNEGSVVKEGTFEVNVNNAPATVCRHDFLRSFNDSDCNFPSNYCGQYFDRCL